MALSIYLDVVNKVAVRSKTSSVPAILPPFFFGTKLDLNIYPLEPNPDYPATDAVNQYISVDWSAYAVSAEVGHPDADESEQAAAVTTSFNNISGGKSGSLDLNVQGIADLLGDNSSERSSFEIKATPPGGVADVFLQIGIDVTGVVLKPGVVVPPQALVDFIIRSEALATFVKRVGLPGENQIFTSPSGNWQRIIGVRDDGTEQDDLVPVP